MKHGGQPAQGRSGRRAAGMTFLEVVFASIVLGLIVTSLTSAISFMIARETRLQHRLACSELAHRLIIMHLDDPKSVPSNSLPLGYGRDYYRWEMDVSKLEAEPVSRDLLDNRSADRTLDRFRRITVRVWLGEDSGGSRDPQRGVPRVELSRVFDRLPRNPDSLEEMTNSEEGMRRLIEVITGQGADG